MTLDEVKAEIAKMRQDEKSYQYIADGYKVNKAIIYRIHDEKDDYVPKDKAIRRKLGLEDLTVDFVRQVRSSKGTFTKDKEQ